MELCKNNNTNVEKMGWIQKKNTHAHKTQGILVNITLLYAEKSIFTGM